MPSAEMEDFVEHTPRKALKILFRLKFLPPSKVAVIIEFFGRQPIFVSSSKPLYGLMY